MRKLIVGGVVAVLAVGLSIALAKGVLGLGGKAESSQNDSSANAGSAKATRPSGDSGNQGTAMAAMKDAAKEKKYLFAVFFKEQNEQMTAMKKTVDAVVVKAPDRATSVLVRVTDPAEKDIVEKFGLDRAPSPLALAIAPNGAVMGGFPTKCSEADLLNAFGSPTTEKCMKSLQDGKLVFLCVQNDSTKSNSDAIKGVNEFKADARFGGATEIVMVDPANSADASFLGDLKIDPKTQVAVTVFLAPPGSALAKFEGATDKDHLVDILQKASTGCGPGGCGPGGCGPKR